MTATKFYRLLKIALADKIEALDGSPLFFTAPSIDFLKEAFVVASISLSSRTPHNNYDADFTAEFILHTPVSTDWTSERIDAVFEALVAILNDQLTKENLATLADENDIAIEIPIIRWDSLSAPTQGNNRRIQSISFTGVCAL